MEDLALCDLFFASIPMIALYLVVDWLIHKPRVSGIEDKYILITGCDSGFGREAALKFDKVGCHVFAACLTEQGLMEIQVEASDKLVPIMLDVTKLSNIEKVFSIINQLIPEGKGLWGLINNAGLPGPMGPYAWLTDKDIQGVLDVNVMGTINMVQTFLPLLKVNKDSRIVNVSSILGRLCTPYSGCYSLSKHAIEAFSDAIRCELYMFGIKVSIIEPGGHHTNFLTKVGDNFHAAWDKLPHQEQEAYGISYFEKVMQLSTGLIPFMATKSSDGVMKAFDHALFARVPRIRYLVGRDAKLLSIIANFPHWMNDLVFTAPFVRPVPACLSGKDKGKKDK